MKLPVLWIFCCTYVAVRGQSGNANEYLDQILDNARNSPQVRSVIDPLVLGNVSFPKGNATDIRVSGITSLHRMGPATLGFVGSKMVIEAHVGLEALSVDIRYKYKPGRVLKLNGGIGAQVKSIHCYIKLTLAGVRARLEEFKVVSFGGVELTRFSGVSLLFNWLAKSIANLVLRRKRSRITQIIEAESRQAIAKALEKADIRSLLPE